MKVISIELKNFKAHEELFLDVNGKNIFLLGPNESGKSSILDSIFFVLNPAKETPETKIQKPLRSGQKDGYAQIVVGADGKTYTVTRKFTEGSDERKIIIETSDGVKTTKLDMLEGLIGYRHINPFEFVEWSKTADGRRKQLQMIETLLPEHVIETLNTIKRDIALKDEALKTVNLERLTLERSVNSLGVTEVDLQKYSEPIDIADEMVKLKVIQAANAERAKAVEELEQINESIDEYDKEIKELEIRLTKKRVERDQKAVDYANKCNWIDRNPVKSSAAVEARINEAQEHNSRNTLVKKHAEQCVALKEKSDTCNGIKAEIEGMREQRRGMIALSDLPIDGLTFDTEQVYLEGLPLHANQISTSQIMKLAFAIALAMEQPEKKLKLLCIPRGESLDTHSVEQLKAFLHENSGWQAFVEEVDRGEEKLKVEYFES